MHEEILIKYSEKLNRIIELSKISGKWSHHFDLIDWDNPNILNWQKQAREIEDKRKEAIEDFLTELYIDLTGNKKKKHWTEEPLE
jgi:hypothetical protein